MPIVDFRCDKCGFTDEFLISFSVEGAIAPTKCDKCTDGVMERLFSTGKTIGIDFVGPGFYINDHGTHNWKARLSSDDQSKVLNPNENGVYKNPY